MLIKLCAELLYCRCYFEAIRVKPDFAIAWSNLAGVLKEENQLTTAIAYYRY
jgi:protein O-GlcNAc transferase